jgi:hypothetical protein
MPVEESSGNIDSAVTKRLDVIIRLLLDQQRKDTEITKKEQILALDSIGLTSNEIGKIVGWPAKNVGSELAKFRRSK